jgi:competence protein ComEC
MVAQGTVQSGGVRGGVRISGARVPGTRALGAGTWDAAPPRGFSWPSGLSLRGARDVLQSWLARDVASGRLFPWVPVAFGFGVVLYFTAEHEPAVWAAPALTLALAIAAFLARARTFAFPLLVALTAAAAGFATATLRAAHVAHPVLHHAAFNISLTGFIETREQRVRTDRIVVRVREIEGNLHDTPERVRLSVKKHMAPPVGTFIEVKARLTPPMRPSRPGGYDLSRDLYFQGIGATGFVSGAIKTLAPPVKPDGWLRYGTLIAQTRGVIDRRIRAALSDDNAAIASALLTGTRDAISTPVNDAMFISGLGHVLSISGYHMALVAGVVFFAVRALLALIPVLATRYPIKKWAAFAALLAALFYLLLSGAEVATQRSFFMTGLLLLAVMLDRAALTFRNLALAALIVMLLAPESVVNPSFQMSFAATLGLISAYERGIPWMRAGADTSRGARIALWGGRETVAMIVVSLAAGTATMPYVGYLFHRLGPYGVVANLLAMPIVSAWVMPAGLLALLVMPFGLDAPLWRLMGIGIDWMVWVAQFVASFPGAVGRIVAFSIGPLLLCTAGLLVLCLLRSPLRFAGAVTVLAAALWAFGAAVPDVYVGTRGDVVGVRGASDRLSVMRTANGDTLAVGEWLAADADVRTPKDPSLKDGVTCDEIGCVARLRDGAIVALPFSAESFEEDCRRAALAISSRTAPPSCAAMVIDRSVWRRTGAAALYRTGKGWETVVAYPPGYDRPWATAVPPRAGATTPRVPADATPKAEDLGADD